MANQRTDTAAPPISTATIEGENAPPFRANLWLAALIFGYIGIYLCRKNFSVAVPLLQEHFNATRGEIGLIASYSTLAYALGKFIFGVVIDRIGGRAGFFGALLLVAVMGIAGGLAPSLGMLAIFYSANRFAGAAAWPAMVKMTPDWFSGRHLPFAIAVLSLSFVVGGACATAFAGIVANVSGNSWRAVMAVPSFVLLIIIAFSWFILPRKIVTHEGRAAAAQGFVWADLLGLLRLPHFWIICALSFALTLLRETFNTWTVDFIKTEGGPEVSNQVAAFLSTPFDIMGALGILTVGWLYGRLTIRKRQCFIFGLLASLAVVLYYLPTLFQFGLGTLTVAIGLVGFLTYGPYSLLAGTLAVEVRGQKSVGTVSGMVDGVGYIAAILAGAQFGQLVDAGGYGQGFRVLAALAGISAVLSLFLYQYFIRERGPSSAQTV